MWRMEGGSAVWRMEGCGERMVGLCVEKGRWVCCVEKSLNRGSSVLSPVIQYLAKLLL